MKILIIGGTRFVGRALVETAVSKGHTVTLFNRGKSNPDLFADVETIVGDRDGGLDGLRGRSWDVVIDTCGYLPRLVRDSAELLKDAVEQYIFISTISVYADFASRGMDESAPLATMADETVEEITGETYGALKVLCEKAVDEVINGRVLHIRPGFIVGPHDMTDRFSYYPHRIAQGGSVLLPESPDWPMQVIDTRDLAEWTILAAEQQLTGIYNITGPNYPLSFRKLVETCQDISQSNATFTYASEQFLQENDAQNAFPLWAWEEDAGVHTVNSQKAIAAGLTFRPLAETVRDTLGYLDTLPVDHEWKVGLQPAQEADLLAKWKDNSANEFASTTAKSAYAD